MSFFAAILALIACAAFWFYLYNDHDYGDYVKSLAAFAKYWRMLFWFSVAMAVWDLFISSGERAVLSLLISFFLTCLWCGSPDGRKWFKDNDIG